MGEKTKGEKTACVYFVCVFVIRATHACRGLCASHALNSMVAFCGALSVSPVPIGNPNPYRLCALVRCFVHRYFLLLWPARSGQQVSAFGDSGEGDGGDSWELICVHKDSENWARDESVKLKHVSTKK